jgi:glycosyltransferase involved in cell wall biosynthesis
MPARFLLIAFRFPPYDRIGAYRWSKLCGRLAARGHDIDVLTVPWPRAADPGWHGDVEHPRIRVHRTESLYPHRFRHLRPESRVLQRLHGRVLGAFDRVVGDHDAAVLWGYTMLPRAREILHATHARVVIATGAPYSANLWAARLKQSWPALRLIQDFRDPWLSTQAELATSPEARDFRVATRAADILVSVTPEMSALFAELSGHPRVETIENGVELRKLERERRDVPTRFDFAYVGGLYNQREVPFGRFVEWMRVRRKAGRGVRTVVAGLYPHHLAETFGDLVRAGDLVFEPLLPQSEAFERLLAARWALQFNGPVAFAHTQTTTKLVEHAALRRPTLSLNYGGATEALVRSRQLGVSLRADAGTLFAELDAAFGAPPACNFDVSDFDFDATAARYSALIDELAGVP